MAVQQIITAENPLLREKSKKIHFFGDSIKKLVEDLFDTLHAANGLGLAAPQIGVLQRVYIVELPPEYDEEGNEISPSESYVMINPEIVRRRGEEEMDEGCLSVPGYRGVVTRSTRVTVKAQDIHGHSVRYRADDLLAQAFQHEGDHLDGILYIDRIESADKLWRIRVGDEELIAEK